MDSRMVLYNVLRCLGLCPFDGAGRLSKFYSSLTVLLGIVFNCLTVTLELVLVYLSYRQSISSQKDFHTYARRILAMSQTLPSTMVAVNLIRHWRSLEMRLINNPLLQPHQIGPKTFENFAIVFGVLMIPVYFLFVFWIKNPLGRIYVLLTIVNGLQMYFSSIMFFDFTTVSLAFIPMRENINVFRNQRRFLKCFQLLMKVFEIPLLMTYMSCFCFVVWMNFEIIYKFLFDKNFFKRDPYAAIIEISFSACFLGFKIMTMVLPCVAAQRCHTMLDNHYNRLFNIMKDNPVLCKKASLYLYVTTKHKVKLTVCGFFTLGYPLITSIIAGCATYLVVLIQFIAS